MITHYKANSSGCFFFAYQCSRCGAKNIKSECITAKHRSSHYGSEKAEYMEGAKKQASCNLILKIGQAVRDIENGDYQNVTFTCRCRKCKYREYWARPLQLTPVCIASGVIIISLVIATVILSIFTIIGSISLKTFIPVLCSVVLLLTVCLLLFRNSFQKTQLEIDSLSAENYPIPAPTKEGLMRRVGEKYFFEAEYPLPGDTLEKNNHEIYGQVNYIGNALYIPAKFLNRVFSCPFCDKQQVVGVNDYCTECGERFILYEEQ